MGRITELFTQVIGGAIIVGFVQTKMLWLFLGWLGGLFCIGFLPEGKSVRQQIEIFLAIPELSSS